MTPANQNPVPKGTGYQTTFATQNIAPANTIYFTTDDNLFFYCVPSVVCTLRIGIRYLLPTGEVKVGEYDMTTSATRTPQVMIQDLGEGFILGINVFCLTQALRRGQCWIKFVLQRGGINVQQLTQTICQGYVTEYTSLFWPSAQTDYELAGFGSFRSITGTVPAAGAEITETVPVGAVWRLVSWRATITASATVASRGPTLVIDDGANILVQIPQFQNITAGNSISPNYVIASANFSNGGSLALQPLPSYQLLPAGFRIRSLTIGIQVNDQWTAPQYQVEEWLQP